MDDIITSLWNLLFGMVGVFVVMGVIMLSLFTLNYISGKKAKETLDKSE